MEIRIERDILIQASVEESKKKGEDEEVTPRSSKKRKREYSLDDPRKSALKRRKYNNEEYCEESTRLVKIYTEGISQINGENQESYQKSQMIHLWKT